jgi:hypothetical protein
MISQDILVITKYAQSWDDIEVSQKPRVLTCRGTVLGIAAFFASLVTAASTSARTANAM